MTAQDHLSSDDKNTPPPEGGAGGGVIAAIPQSPSTARTTLKPYYPDTAKSDPPQAFAETHQNSRHC